jgi:gliding motility-associated lipoprotein GldD
MMWPRYIAALVLLVLVGCEQDPVPKPRGYFRIDLPEQRYARWSDPASFSAELPAYARMVEQRSESDARWYDLRFPGQRATVHLTWTAVNGSLGALIEDAHAFKGKHEMKAARIGRDRVLRDSVRVYGTLFDVDGDVASPLVFYLTDSTRHFLYGALYFDSRPNADSLAPVTQRIREDVRHLAGTLEWGSGKQATR